jgi:hypothetical protein
VHWTPDQDSNCEVIVTGIASELSSEHVTRPAAQRPSNGAAARADTANNTATSKKTARKEFK